MPQEQVWRDAENKLVSSLTRWFLAFVQGFYLIFVLSFIQNLKLSQQFNSMRKTETRAVGLVSRYAYRNMMPKEHTWRHTESTKIVSRILNTKYSMSNNFQDFFPNKN